MATNRGRQAMAAIALLAGELRQRLYRFVAAQPTPVTRDQAAAAAGISRKLAAFHLDKLLAAGLLEATTPDPASRPPGPGRAPKAYRPTTEEVAVSVPQRRYDALGELLTQALGERVRAQRRLVGWAPSAHWGSPASCLAPAATSLPAPPPTS